MNVIDIVIIMIAGLIIVLQVLRIMRLLFAPRFLRHKIFEFPESISVRTFYYLCSILVLLMLALMTLGVI
jgi:hypothetical protein